MDRLTQSRRLPLWWRALMAVSAAAAIVVSFTYLRDLAQYCGWPAEIAWLLPVSTDALAAGALTAYILTRGWFAAVVSAFVIAGTATGNALAHIYDVTATTPSLLVVVCVGIAPVVNAFLIGHFVAHEARKDANEPVAQPPMPAAVPVRGGAGDAGATTGRMGTTTGPLPDSHPGPARGGSKSRTRARAGAGRPQTTRRRNRNAPSLDTVIAAIHGRDPSDLSRRGVMDEFGVGYDKADIAIKAVTNGSHQ